MDLNITYEYYEKVRRYFFSNKISNEAPIVEADAVIQASSEDTSFETNCGIAFANTNNFANYDSFDFHKKYVVVSRIRESTNTGDNRVFTLKHGSWFSSHDPTVVVVNDSTKEEYSTTDFIALPKDGKIILDDEIPSGYSVLVTIPQDVDFKLVAELASYDDDVDLSDVGIMWNNDERGLSPINATRLPTASNVYISPTSPQGGQALYANYVLYDRNGRYISGNGISSGTKVEWYRNGDLQSAYENVIRIPGGAVQYGDTWYFVVTPHDGVRQGNPVQSPSVTIMRGLPVAFNVKINPSTPTTVNDLVLTYDYDSPDDTPEASSELRWYLNGVLQPQFNGRIAIFSSETSSGQSWYATVRPYDGYNYGSLVKSNVVVIDHSPPTIGNSLAIYPDHPHAGDELYVQYNFASDEGLSEYGPFPDWEDTHPDEEYPEGATTIKWYKNGVLQTSFNNQVSVSGEYVVSGDEWYVVVAPGDGITRGIEKTSPEVIVI